jgi:hypothetical protein
MGEMDRKVAELNRKVEELGKEIMEQIARSKDEVSKTLTPIFTRAVEHSGQELQLARERKERGNPPGKKDSRIGDELTWEQILAAMRGKKRLWVISRDEDYGTVFRERGYLNKFLYDELTKVSRDVEAFYFDDLVDGIEDYANKTGMPARNLPAAAERTEIKREERTLPPLDWLSGNSAAAAGVLMSGWQQSRATLHPSHFASGDPGAVAVYYDDTRRMSPALWEAIASGMPIPAGKPQEQAKTQLWLGPTESGK